MTIRLLAPVERMMKLIRVALSLVWLSLGSGAWAAPGEWQPAKGPLMTRWARDVSPKNAHPEYPRPQMARKAWQNLNGLWDYAIRPKNESQPSTFDGKILVPFPVESALSGVMKQAGEENRLWYRRAFAVPKSWLKKRVLLHFGAVDWEATVWVNGKELGTHRGGYDGFGFDITGALKAKGENDIVLSVWDPTDAGPQPRGKQVRKPRGIWYTPASGIWQTVWLEPFSDAHIHSVEITPNVDEQSVDISVTVTGAPADAGVRATLIEGKRDIAYTDSTTTRSGTMFLRFKLSQPKLWSPDEPYLYDLKLTLRDGRTRVDEVHSYFGMRKISMARDGQDRLRLQLNNKPYFMLGPLDQGFWPDGLYTAPTDEALRYDIELLKKLGFNMARKHVKVEPDRWYYWCDKLGLLVWQDMPSGGKSAEWRGPSGVDGKEMKRTPESEEVNGLMTYDRSLVKMDANAMTAANKAVYTPAGK